MRDRAILGYAALMQAYGSAPAARAYRGTERKTRSLEVRTEVSWPAGGVYVKRSLMTHRATPSFRTGLDAYNARHLLGMTIL